MSKRPAQEPVAGGYRHAIDIGWTRQEECLPVSIRLHDERLIRVHVGGASINAESWAHAFAVAQAWVNGRAVTVSVPANGAAK